MFLTERNGIFHVTDGGWINEQYYDAYIDLSDESYNKLFNYYKEQYSIKETNVNSLIYYYKSTSNRNLIPNIIYDLCNFIYVVVSSSFIAFQDEKERASLKMFRSQANDYVKAIFDKKEVLINSKVDSNAEVKFNAVVVRANKFSLINYVTGTSESYFINSIGKSNMNFQIINKSSYSNSVSNRITLVNDSAPGYKINRLRQYLALIEDQANSIIVNWSEKKVLKELV